VVDDELIWDRCYDFKNIFAEKKIAKKFAFLTKNKAKLCKFLIITLDFEKNANFFAENLQKSQKIVIITSTHGHPYLKPTFLHIKPSYFFQSGDRKFDRRPKKFDSNFFGSCRRELDLQNGKRGRVFRFIVRHQILKKSEKYICIKIL
jgi:hypothetical protein